MWQIVLFIVLISLVGFLAFRKKGGCGCGCGCAHHEEKKDSEK